MDDKQRLALKRRLRWSVETPLTVDSVRLMWAFDDDTGAYTYVILRTEWFTEAGWMTLVYANAWMCYLAIVEHLSGGA